MSDTIALRHESPSRGRGRRLTRVSRLGASENLAFFVAWRDYWESFARSVTGGAEPVEETFGRLASTWKQAIGSRSNPEVIRAAEGFAELVALGWEAVPLIIRELDSDPFYWFEVLAEIAQTDPTPPRQAGNVDAMVRAWKRWYVKQIKK